MNTIKALRYAYRHTWRSNRLGFFKAVAEGFEVYQAGTELKLLLFVAAWVGMTAFVLSNYKWVS